MNIQYLGEQPVMTFKPSDYAEETLVILKPKVKEEWRKKLKQNKLSQMNKNKIREGALK